MYLRKAVVHCRVVALSVSEEQNGTSRLSSSQHTRILLLWVRENIYSAEKTTGHVWQPYCLNISVMCSTRLFYWGKHTRERVFSAYTSDRCSLMHDLGPVTCGPAPCCYGAPCAEWSPWGGPSSFQACLELLPWGLQSAGLCLGPGHGTHGSSPVSDCRAYALWHLSRHLMENAKEKKTFENRALKTNRGYQM